MKVVAFVFIALMASLCLAAPRRALVSNGRNDVVAEEEAMAETAKNGQVVDGTIENHHNIPRQYYDQWGSGSNSGDNNSNGGG